MMKRLLFLLCFLSVSAWAEPIAVMDTTPQGVKIMLYNDPCKIKAPINLGYRATWTEGVKTFEGCFTVFVSASQQSVGAYFEDNTMVVAPVDLFVPVTSL